MKICILGARACLLSDSPDGVHASQQYQQFVRDSLDRFRPLVLDLRY